MSSVVLYLRLSTTVYVETYTNDSTMVDSGDIIAFKAKNCVCELHWLVNSV